MQGPFPLLSLRHGFQLYPPPKSSLLFREGEFAACISSLCTELSHCTLSRGAPASSGDRSSSPEERRGAQHQNSAQPLLPLSAFPSQLLLPAQRFVSKPGPEPVEPQMLENPVTWEKPKM